MEEAAVATALASAEPARKPGLSIETRLGMGVIVILMCAFGFLVYRKFDARQQQLLSLGATAAADETTHAVHSESSVNADSAEADAGGTQQTSFRKTNRDSLTQRDATPVTAVGLESAETEPGVQSSGDTAHTRPAADSDLPFADFSEPAVADTSGNSDTVGQEEVDPFAVTAAEPAEAPRGLFEEPAAEPATSDAASDSQWVSTTPNPTTADGAAEPFDFGAADQSDDSADATPFAFADAADSSPAAASQPATAAEEEVVFDFGAFTEADTPAESSQQQAAPATAQVADQLAEVGETDPLKPVQADGFADFAAVPVPTTDTITDSSAGKTPAPSTQSFDSDLTIPESRPTESTEIAMLQLPPFEPADNSGQAGNAADSARGNRTDFETATNSFDAVDTFGDGSTVRIPAAGSPAVSAQAPAAAFNMGEFTYENGVRQVAHTTEPCDICDVLPNDNYWSISKRAYGTARYFSALALYNQHRISDPKKMRPGMKVLIPDASVLESRFPELFRDYQTKPSLPTGYFTQEDGQPAYRVGERETLSEIAERHLGRSSRWVQIYRLNRSTLSDPNKLKPGTVILLPEDAANVQVLP